MAKRSKEGKEGKREKGEKEALRRSFSPFDLFARSSLPLFSLLIS